MSKIYIWLTQLTNFLLYMSLQILIMQHILPLYKATCFVYVGFFLFLPWKKNSFILQLLVGFLVGLIVDAFYDSLGVHAFAAVLLVYLRNFLLHVLLPYPASVSEHITRPTLRNMGFKKFFVYVFFLLFVYHITVLCLSVWNSMFFFTTLPGLILSMILSCFFILFLQALFTVAIGTVCNR